MIFTLLWGNMSSMNATKKEFEENNFLSEERHSRKSIENQSGTIQKNVICDPK